MLQNLWKHFLITFITQAPCAGVIRIGLQYTEPEIMVCTWSGELCYCSYLPVLLGPAWVLLSYVLHTFISGSVKVKKL